MIFVDVPLVQVAGVSREGVNHRGIVTSLSFDDCPADVGFHAGVPFANCYDDCWERYAHPLSSRPTSSKDDPRPIAGWASTCAMVASRR